MAEQEDRRRKPSLIARVTEQLLPAVLTATVLGVIGFKVMEYRVEDLEKRHADNAAILARHTIEITQQQERLTAAVERYQAALQGMEKTIDRIEQRLDERRR